MRESIPIPSKYENNVIMLAEQTGYIPKKNESTTGFQSPSGVNKVLRIDKRVGMIL